MTSPCNINGVIYTSQAAAARELNCTRNKVHKAIVAGRDQRFVPGEAVARGKSCTFNGTEYPSQKAAAADLGVPRNAISLAVKEGRTTVKAKSQNRSF